MTVDIHLHYLSPHALDAARRHPDRYGVRVLDGPEPSLRIGDEAPTRPLLPALYTLDLHTRFLGAHGIDHGVFGPLMEAQAAILGDNATRAFHLSPTC
jgi:hypothetical protein